MTSGARVASLRAAVRGPTVGGHRRPARGNGTHPRTAADLHQRHPLLSRRCDGRLNHEDVVAGGPRHRCDRSSTQSSPVYEQPAVASTHSGPPPIASQGSLTSRALTEVRVRDPGAHPSGIPTARMSSQQYRMIIDRPLGPHDAALRTRRRGTGRIILCFDGRSRASTLMCNCVGGRTPYDRMISAAISLALAGDLCRIDLFTSRRHSQPWDRPAGPPRRASGCRAMR